MVTFLAEPILCTLRCTSLFWAYFPFCESTGLNMTCYGNLLE